MATEMEIIRNFFQREKDDKVIRYRHLNKSVKKGQILFTGSSDKTYSPSQIPLLLTQSAARSSVSLAAFVSSGDAAVFHKRTVNCLLVHTSFSSGSIRS